MQTEGRQKAQGYWIRSADTRSNLADVLHAILKLGIHALRRVHQQVRQFTRHALTFLVRLVHHLNPEFIGRFVLADGLFVRADESGHVFRREVGPGFADFALCLPRRFARAAAIEPAASSRW